jgi:hypothetical protein
MTFNHLHKHLFKRRGDLLFFFFVLTCLFSLEGYSEGADLFSKPLTQSGVFTSPFMHIVDLNGDGRDDLFFYEKKRDGKISILLNTGEWKDMLSPEKKSMPSNEK